MMYAVLSSLIIVSAALSGVAAASASSADLRGVSPGVQNKYKPDSASKWRCLDGTRVLPFKAVNDDFCDCADGSDEPGML